MLKNLSIRYHYKWSCHLCRQKSWDWPNVVKYIAYKDPDIKSVCAKCYKIEWSYSNGVCDKNLSFGECIKRIKE